jgi:ATP-dependent protease ClpP protease subunit
MNYLFLLLLFSHAYAFFTDNIKEITLNVTNSISIKGEINHELASKFIHELNQKKDKTGVYVYLDTNGGSVDAGNLIVDEIQKYELDCIAQNAASMGFIILQACKTRYITKYGTLMQHQMSYGIMNEKEKVDSYTSFITQIADVLMEMQSNRINIDKKIFKEKTFNDWWLFGVNAIKENCADELAYIKCTSALTNKTYTEDIGSYTYTYSKCPLVNKPIKKTKNNEKMNIEDFLYFL